LWTVASNKVGDTSKTITLSTAALVAHLLIDGDASYYKPPEPVLIPSPFQNDDVSSISRDSIH
jgi:hypothetical protein